jgi:hypothetical protein
MGRTGRSATNTRHLESWCGMPPRRMVNRSSSLLAGSRGFMPSSISKRAFSRLKQERKSTLSESRHLALQYLQQNHREHYTPVISASFARVVSNQTKLANNKTFSSSFSSPTSGCEIVAPRAADFTRSLHMATSFSGPVELIHTYTGGSADLCVTFYPSVASR